ncbi:MAG TPA: tRNA (adenosine(37)-N6)-dimethylallyltransferase MiaA [Actinomycetota bacterium]|jgi:tRNA dimethylallyltransferase|nr:tRNA (adenosine(37)-N6)-dimethylallyltransferase MiaA [Actinomycetota bacterium]
MARPALLALVGPTASGKTEAGVVLAERLGAEIVSVDSMLVYRGMDVGTDKPDRPLRARVPHHLLDLVEPNQAFSVAQYQRLAHRVLAHIRDRGRPALLVGGSGLYFRAVVDELEFPATDPGTRRDLQAEATALGAEGLHARLALVDPAAAERIEPGNVRRTVRALEVAAVTGRPFSSYAEGWDRYPTERVRAAGIELARPALEARIRARVEAMVAAGLLEEVRGLLDRGLFGWLTASQAIGYAEFARHVRGELSLEQAVEGTVGRTRELARRQMVWFRRDPRIRWFRAGAEGATALGAEIEGYLRGG